jgi:hypothetical protein
MARQIREQRAEDSLIGIKIGAELCYNKLIQLLGQDRHGVRAELLIALPSMLAGFACQAATWESLVVGQGYPVESVFIVADTQDGGQYPFSDPMNHLLLEDQYSVWGLIAAAAKAKGAESLPDMEELVTHVVRSIGTPAFGQPRLPSGLSLGGETPLELVRTGWENFLPLLGLSCVIPEEWPALFAVAVQKAMEAARQLIDPATAATLAMECALPMAHLPMRRL